MKWLTRQPKRPPGPQDPVRPSRVEGGKAELLRWAARSKAGECHVWAVDTTGLGRYVIHIRWPENKVCIPGDGGF